MSEKFVPTINQNCALVGLRRSFDDELEIKQVNLAFERCEPCRASCGGFYAIITTFI